MIAGVVCWKRVTKPGGAGCSSSSMAAIGGVHAGDSRSPRGPRRHAPGCGIDVRPVDRQRRQRVLNFATLAMAADICVACSANVLAEQALDVLGERPADLLELGLVRDLAERARVARHLLPQRGQRSLAGRVDEQRAHVVEELVADRARHRPVAQLLAGVEDLLDPHALDAARAAAPGSRRDRPARPGGRCAARRPRRRGPARAPARASPRTPPGPPGARRPGRRCRRSAGTRRSTGRRRRTSSRSSGSAQ